MSYSIRRSFSAEVIRAIPIPVSPSRHQKAFALLQTLTLLLLCQFAGEVFVRSAGLPVPGPVAGLALLAVLLLVWVQRKPDLAETGLARHSTALIGILGLLLIPTGAGVVNQLGLLQGHGLAIVVTILVSAVLTMVATVFTFILVKRLMGVRS